MADILVNNFFFISERIVLKHATNILRLTSDFEVQHYLDDLEHNKEILRLKIDCQKRLDVHLNLKQVISELYCFSFCNVNVLKLYQIIKTNDI